VSFDSPADNHAFRLKFEFPFALLSDTDKSMAIAYGAADDAGAAYPRRAACIVDARGTVVQWYAKVDAREFPALALAALPR
jgi:thioredoxin-dependent peroxiredoxin